MKIQDYSYNGVEFRVIGDSLHLKQSNSLLRFKGALLTVGAPFATLARTIKELFLGVMNLRNTDNPHFKNALHLVRTGVNMTKAAAYMAFVNPEKGCAEFAKAEREQHGDGDLPVYSSKNLRYIAPCMQPLANNKTSDTSLLDRHIKYLHKDGQGMDDSVKQCVTVFACCLLLCAPLFGLAGIN